MNPTTIAAAIGAAALVLVAAINAYSARMVAKAEKEAREANAKASTIIQSVDGTQTRILAQLEKLTAENADRGGQLKERDRTEDRKDRKEEQGKSE